MNNMLFKIIIAPNVVSYDTMEWNGRSSDDLHGYIRDEKKLQEGWKITFLELDVDFSKEEAAFVAAFSSIEKAKKEASFADIAGIEVNYPSRITKEIYVGKTTPCTSRKEVLISEDEAQFELIPEEFYAFTRVGMSTKTTFARKCVLAAPIKSNRAGLSVRGYAAVMLSDELDDQEFCEYIFNLNS